mmetsp:Transcript_2151/g.6221  ORF Transcript_2151/g.6221 Transcript_2151/m.6221 type:complete len:351 (+) Transcript_2151:66-1118(+)
MRHGTGRSSHAAESCPGSTHERAPEASVHPLRVLACGGGVAPAVGVEGGRLVRLQLRAEAREPLRVAARQVAGLERVGAELEEAAVPAVAHEVARDLVRGGVWVGRARVHGLLDRAGEQLPQAALALVDDERRDGGAARAGRRRVGQRLRLVADHARLVVVGRGAVVRGAQRRAGEVGQARLGADGELRPRGGERLAEQECAQVVRVDRRQRGLGGAVVRGVHAREGGEGCVPVPQRGEAVPLDASPRRRQEAARDEGVAADAALPVVHLATAQGKIVGAGGAVAVHWAAVVGREDDERVVPHALALEGGRCTATAAQCGTFPHGCWCGRSVDASDHGCVYVVDRGRSSL